MFTVPVDLPFTLLPLKLFYRGFKFQAQVAPETPLTLRKRVQRFDPWGTLIFIPAIVSVLLTLQWGGSKYAWDNGRIIALFVLFRILITAFVGIQKCDGPASDLDETQHLVRGWFSLALGASFFVFVYYLPIWLQAFKVTSVVKSGLDNLPMLLALVLSTITCGVLITMFGYYTPAIWLSTVLMTVGAGLILTFKLNTGHAKWIGYQVLYGFGLGCGARAPVMPAQTVLELKDVPIGTSIQIFMQTLGGALFISVAQNVFQNKLIAGLAARVPEVPAELIFAAGATNLKSDVDPQFLPAVLEVYNAALASAFQVGVAMAGVSIVGYGVEER
ncbi:hypothetical protein DFH08DRAFT_936825 [Mycena albidolilacea]|uniref:Uncharacterized protein n=1 Tax=Mycena albidolilacea TaxID=1033008 RepID=A0AAD7A0Q2_9AGAR|nr:hypothetical protein DFH08DRAFT_936825 [Mycena albidolilacea]